MAPQMMTVTQFAKALGINRRTAQRWVREGRVKGTRTPGGHWRIEASELEDRDLTLAEFAREVGICHRTAQRWVKSGKLDAVETPGGFMVAVAEVRRLGTTRGRP